MKIKISLLLVLLILLMGCSSNSASPDLAGSGSNTGNAFVVGVAEHGGKPYNDSLSQVRVALIPENNELEDVQYSTIDSYGGFSFPVTAGKRYSIQIDDTLHDMGYLKFDVSTLDTLEISCEMQQYGYVELAPNDVTSKGGVISIPGTVISHEVETQITRSTDTMYLEHFPVGKYDGLYFTEGAENAKRFTKPFEVQPNDTVKAITTFVPVENSEEFNAGLPSQGIYALSMDDNDRLLMGTDNGYVGIYDDDGWSYIDIYNYGVYSSVIALTFDTNNSLWCGTFDGVLHFNGKDVKHYHTDNSDLPGNTVRSVAVDSTGGKWFTTVDAGIACKSDSGWRVFNTENSKFPSLNAFRVTADREAVWAITPNGIARFRNDEWYTFNKLNSPFSCDSMTAMEITDEQRWFAAWDGSVYLQIEGWWKRFDERNSPLTEFPIFALHVDREGTLWAANTNSELFAYNNKKWTTFNPQNSSIPEDCGMILSIVEQTEGNIFIATEKQGVIQLQSKTEEE